MSRQIIERFTSTGNVLEANSKNLPQGVLCRAKYLICSCGQKNRNNRVYEKAVWDNVLADKEIQEKLNNRALFFHAEHPTASQSNTEKVAGIVTEIRVDESKNEVHAVMEVLDTPYGRIVDTLLRAGCGIGVSTRADGELEEALDEAGDTYQRVIPESYKFVTVDFTADCSTYGSERPMEVERGVINTIKQGVDDSKIDADFAVHLVETFESPEAMALVESLKHDQKHKSCKCKASDKKCLKGCKKVVIEKLDPDSQEVANISKKYGFGSVAWQDAMIARIKRKLEAKEQLAGLDISFIETQLIHNKSLEIEELDKMWKANNANVPNESIQKCGRCDKVITGKGVTAKEGHEVYCSKECAEQKPEAEQMTEGSKTITKDALKKIIDEIESKKVALEGITYRDILGELDKRGYNVDYTLLKDTLIEMGWIKNPVKEDYWDDYKEWLKRLKAGDKHKDDTKDTKKEANEDYQDDTNKIHHGAVCSYCGKVVTEGEYGKGESNCCKADVVTEEEFGKNESKLKEHTAKVYSADTQEVIGVINLQQDGSWRFTSPYPTVGVDSLENEDLDKLEADLVAKGFKVVYESKVNEQNTKCPECGWVGGITQLSIDQDNYPMCPACKARFPFARVPKVEESDMSKLSDKDIVVRYKELVKDEHQELNKEVDALMKEIQKRGLEGDVMKIGEANDKESKEEYIRRNAKIKNPNNPFYGMTEEEIQNAIKEAKIYESDYNRAAIKADIKNGLSKAEVINKILDKYESLKYNKNDKDIKNAAEQIYKDCSESNVTEKSQAATIDKKVVDFLQDHWEEFLSADDAIKNIQDAYKLDVDTAKEYIGLVADGKGPIKDVKVKEQVDLAIVKAEKDKALEYATSLEARTKEMKENYIKDVLELQASKNELNETTRIRKERDDKVMELTEALKDKTSVVEALTKKVLDAEALLVEKHNAFESANKEVITRDTKIKELTETHIKTLAELKEVHAKELLTTYTETRINSMGLKLPGNIRTLFESCKNRDEVEALIKVAKDMIREAALHSSKISEIVFHTPTDPVQKEVMSRVGLAFTGMGQNIK